MDQHMEVKEERLEKYVHLRPLQVPISHKSLSNLKIFRTNLTVKRVIFLNISCSHQFRRQKIINSVPNTCGLDGTSNLCEYGRVIILHAQATVAYCWYNVSYFLKEKYILTVLCGFTCRRIYLIVTYIQTDHILSFMLSCISQCGINLAYNYKQFQEFWHHPPTRT